MATRLGDASWVMPGIADSGNFHKTARASRADLSLRGPRGDNWGAVDGERALETGESPRGSE